jgi:hypothetical protein
MQVRRLTKQKYLGTFAEPMQEIPATPPASTPLRIEIDIWGYVAAIPSAAMEGHRVARQSVERTFRSSDGQYEHRLLPTEAEGIYLVVVVDLIGDRVYGHRMLRWRSDAYAASLTGA